MKRRSDIVTVIIKQSSIDHSRSRSINLPLSVSIFAQIHWTTPSKDGGSPFAFAFSRPSTMKCCYCFSSMTLARSELESDLSHGTPSRVDSTKMTVPTMNVSRLIAEKIIPSDWVSPKVDIEGAEFHLVLCLAQFQKASLIDRMFLEERTWFDTGSAISSSSRSGESTASRNERRQTCAFH